MQVGVIIGVLGGKPDEIETRWLVELDLEDFPRVLGGPGRFLRDVPRGLGGPVRRESLIIWAPRGCGGAFGVPRGEEKGKQSSNRRLEIYVDLWICVQRHIQGCRQEV